MSNWVNSPRDWPEDFLHENGNYMCICQDCDKQFCGYKRRIQCKVCYINALESRLALTEKKLGWLPISTAPKDGTCILAVFPASDVPAIIQWNSAERMAYPATWQVAWDGERLGKFDQPTHWMPLPPADPVSREGKTK